MDSFEEWKKTQTRAKADSWPCGNLIHCTCWSRVQESAITMAGVVEFLRVCSRLKRPEASSAYSVGRSQEGDVTIGCWTPKPRQGGRQLLG